MDANKTPDPLLHDGLIELLATLHRARKLATILEADPEVNGYGLDFDNYDSSIGYRLEQMTYEVEKVVGYTVGNRINMETTL